MTCETRSHPQKKLEKDNALLKESIQTKNWVIYTTFDLSKNTITNYMPLFPYTKEIQIFNIKEN